MLLSAQCCWCLRRTFLGRIPTLNVADTEALKEILVKQFDCFANRLVKTLTFICQIFYIFVLILGVVDFLDD